MKEAMSGGAAGKTYAKKKPGQYPKGGGKGLQGDALKGNVSQSTINDIKRMGMTKALALAGRNGATAGGVAREFQEGVRRMYGADRLKAAKAKYAAPAAKSADAARSSVKPPAKKSAPVAKTADAARSSAMSKKPVAKPAAKKKSGTTDPFAKFVFGVGRAAAEPFKSKPTPKK
jgi:hypothetical protein